MPGAGFGQSQPPLPTLHVYSRETVVDVLVTDDKGQPVRGLTRSDFTVEEDNKPQPITSLVEVSKGAPPPPAPALPPDTWINVARMPTSGPVQIFLFDLQASQPQDIARSRKYIADYLRTMPTGTQVALFALSSTRDLRLLKGFTSNGPLAASIVDKLDPEWVRPPAYIVGPSAVPRAIAALNQIAAYVAGVPGRKNLIWIAPRVLMITRDGGQARPSASGPDMTRVHQLMDLYDLFTKEHIAIYPLNPGGVHGLGPAALDAMEVADATGGATSNSNDYQGVIAKIVDDTLHYYTIAYVPPRPSEDGRFHPIKIGVDRPGLHLSYRTGYNDEQPRPPDAMIKADMTQGPMRLGAMPATQILFSLHLQPGTKSPPDQTAGHPAPHTKGAPYTALFLLDPTQLDYTEAPDGTRICSLEFDLGAYDAFSQLAATRSQTLKITLTPAQYSEFTQKPFSFTLPIDLPPGKLDLRAGIFDITANKAGTLEIPLTVPKK
jgi:VWFA-related protein